MRAKDFILEAVDVGFITNYIKKHHDENLHPDYLDNLNKFSKFILKNIPVNSLKLELSGLDRAKVEQYKKMNFNTAPPIVVGDGYVLDGYHRATAAKELGIPSIKAYVGTKDVREGKYGGEPYTYNLPRRQLNVALLIQRGAIFITEPHGDDGWEPDSEGFSLITLHNVELGEPWCKEAKQHLRPNLYNAAAKGLNNMGLSDQKYNQILWSIERLGIPEEQAFLDAVKENKMSTINVDTAIQNTPPVWQQWIKTLPQQLAQEFIDERPNPNDEDIQEYAKLKLASPQPREVRVAELLKVQGNQYNISQAPDDVIADINQKWGIKIPSGKKYDLNPARNRQYAQMSGATAAPSVMINGVITFGVGRFTSACLRGDRTMRVWDLRG